MRVKTEFEYEEAGTTGDLDTYVIAVNCLILRYFFMFIVQSIIDKFFHSYV